MDELFRCDRSNESFSEQYFLVVLFNQWSTSWFYRINLLIKSFSVTIQMTSLWAIAEILFRYTVQDGSRLSNCGWNAKVWPLKWLLPNSTFLWCCYVVQGGSNFWVCGWNPKVLPFKWKLLSSTFLWCYFFHYFGARSLLICALGSLTTNQSQVKFPHKTCERDGTKIKKGTQK